MAVPGVWEEKELKLMLTKLMDNKDEVFKFAVAASGPKEGQLVLDKKQKLKKKEVQDEAEAEARKNGGKAVKLDVMTGECRSDATNNATLRLIVNGKAPAKAVACVEHLLVRGPFKAIGFQGVILEEVEEERADAPAPTTTDGGAAPVAQPDEQAKWEKALAETEPLYLQGLRDRPDDASKLRAVLGFAQGKAEAKDYQAAIAALDKVKEVLRGKTAAATSAGKPAPPPGPKAESDLMARLNALASRIKEFAAAADAAGKEAGTDLEAKKAALAPRNRLLTLVRDCNATVGKNDEQAKAMLAEIVGILDAGPALTATSSREPAGVRADEAKPATRGDQAADADSKVLFTQTRLAWDQTRKKIQADLQKLEQSVLAACLDPELEQTEFDFSTLAADTKTLYTILDNLDERLIDKLDDGLNAADPEKKAQLRADAGKIVKEYLAFVETNELMSVIDANGFAPVNVRKSALDSLRMLGSKL